MYAVVFRAEVDAFDEDYAETVARLRARAIEEYGCLEFVAVSEGDQEIVVSYWESLEQIAAWKQDAEHLAAQARGRARWYRSYRVQVVEVVREYAADRPS